MAPRIGELAPDFTLAGTDCTEEGTRAYTLSELRGRPVVLVFYPGDNTPICTRQLTTYTFEFDKFAAVDAQLLALSPQDVESHRDFSRRNGVFAFPLLADTEKEVARSYGVLGPVGFYRRCTFVVDREGVVRYAHRATAGLSFRPTQEIVEAVRGAGG